MGSENQTPPTESLQDKSLLPSSRTTAQPTHQPAPVLPKPPDYGVSRVPGFVEYEEVAPAPAYTPVAYSAPRTAPPSLPAVPQQSGQGYAHPIASAPTSQLPRHVVSSPCAYGYHEPRIEFGLCGILAAIFFFPIGLLCLCLDIDRRCTRCGRLV